MGSLAQQIDEYPPLADLAKDIYRPFPSVPTDVASASDMDAPALVTSALVSLSDGLRTNDVPKVKQCFLTSQAYWRDMLAFTWHFRTLNDDKTIAPAIAELARQRGFSGGFDVHVDSVQHVAISPTFRMIDGMFTFRTASPAAQCGGKVTLLPEADGDSISWKIWSLATWVDSIESHEENTQILRDPGRNLDETETIDTDVFILGGGNAGIVLAARLKALGVDNVIVDRNAQPGDNWALRYDCLRFHIAKSNCETPYLEYPKELPVILQRDDLAAHMRNYAATFNLNILNSSTVDGASFNTSKGMWNFSIRTPAGKKTVRSKHLVQCTGVNGAKPYVPEIPGAGSYKGVNIHSAEYMNPRTLSDKGAKSVLIIGSANSAFDIMEDCAAAGLATTIVARSPTYIFPWDYALAPEGLGIYERMPAELADKLSMTGPNAISGQLVKGLQTKLAEQEPDRYKALAATGFPVYDSTGGRGDLISHLVERGGGHFNDIGEGIQYIVDGKVGVKARVQPVGYTATGLEFSDGSTLDADAIVWCTGFKDKDRTVTAEILGHKTFVAPQDGGSADAHVLGPQDVARLRDGVWGVDGEGEIRGVFKRNLRLENFWVFGGTTAHHRHFSKPLALQIKAAVEGILPEAYRDTPAAV